MDYTRKLSKDYQHYDSSAYIPQYGNTTYLPPGGISPGSTGLGPSLSLTSSTGYDRELTYESGGYHDRQGLVVNKPGVSGNGRKSRFYKPSSVWQWAFIGTALIQAVVALAMESYVFGFFQESLAPGAGGTVTRTIPCYLSLLIFGFIYQLILVYDALHYQNTIQVIGLCLYNVGLLVYTAIQVDQIHDAVTILGNTGSLKPAVGPKLWSDLRPFLVAVPCVIALGTVLLAGIAFKLYEEFAWNIYKQISADLRLKRRYLIYQIYIALLKFDFFLFLGFEVQFLVIVVNTTDVEFYLTIASVPITILLLLFAAWSTKRENVLGMICVILVYFAALAYFLFKLVRMYGSDPARRQDYLPARRTLTVFAVITIILLLITIAIACCCTANFGKGLKTHVGGMFGRGSLGSKKLRIAADHDAFDLDPASAAAGVKLYADQPYGGGGQYGGRNGVGYGGSRMTID